MYCSSVIDRVMVVTPGPPGVQSPYTGDIEGLGATDRDTEVDCADDALMDAVALVTFVELMALGDGVEDNGVEDMLLVRDAVIEVERVNEVDADGDADAVLDLDMADEAVFDVDMVIEGVTDPVGESVGELLLMISNCLVSEMETEGDTDSEDEAGTDADWEAEFEDDELAEELGLAQTISTWS